MFVMTEPGRGLRYLADVVLAPQVATGDAEENQAAARPDDLVVVAQTSLDFWNNPLDDERWNQA